MLQHATALPPFYNRDSKILILGSFPSVKSRQTAFFYAHPQNKMWRMLSEFFGKPATDVQQRKALLTECRIAMWDIVAECDIEGSKDSSVTNTVIADIMEIVDSCPIEAVFCNGKLSYSLTDKHFGAKLKVPLLCMPSTSPQNVSFDITIWQQALSKFIK